jgi:hypothetical protein
MDLRVNDHHGGWLSLEVFVKPLTHGCCRSPSYSQTPWLMIFPGKR